MLFSVISSPYIKPFQISELLPIDTFSHVVEDLLPGNQYMFQVSWLYSYSIVSCWPLRNANDWSICFIKKIAMLACLFWSHCHLKGRFRFAWLTSGESSRLKALTDTAHADQDAWEIFFNIVQSLRNTLFRSPAFLTEKGSEKCTLSQKDTESPYTNQVGPVSSDCNGIFLTFVCIYSRYTGTIYVTPLLDIQVNRCICSYTLTGSVLFAEIQIIFGTV